MNIIENLFLSCSEEAAEASQAFARASKFGLDSVNPRNQNTAAQDIVQEINEMLAAVELLKDREVVLEGIGDPVAIGEAKKKLVEDMEVSFKAGTLQLPEDGAAAATDGTGTANQPPEENEEEEEETPPEENNGVDTPPEEEEETPPEEEEEEETPPEEEEEEEETPPEEEEENEEEEEETPPKDENEEEEEEEA